MLLERVKMYLDIGGILGQDKMLSLVKQEEARDIYYLLDEMNVDTNSTSQGYCGDEKFQRAYFLRTELIHFGNKNINALFEYCRDLHLSRR